MGLSDLTALPPNHAVWAFGAKRRTTLQTFRRTRAHSPVFGLEQYNGHRESSVSIGKAFKPRQKNGIDSGGTTRGDALNAGLHELSRIQEDRIVPLKSVQE